MTLQEIAVAFSGGRFEIGYPYLTEETRWNIVGQTYLLGKEAIIQYCDKTAAFFSEVTTAFEMNNCIVAGSAVVIDGKATFINQQNKTTHISSCDVYVFEEGKIKEMNSYCIVTQKG